MGTGNEPRIGRLRIYVMSALASALILELIARYMGTLPISKLVSESISLVALLLLTASALYLIFKLQELLALKWLMSLAAFFLLSSQVLNIFDSIPRFNAWFLLGDASPPHGVAKNLTLLLGIIVMLATLYLALLETVAFQIRVLQDRAELSQEISVRKKADAALSESHEQVRRLSAHLEAAREEERTNVAREIHDELGQALTSLRIDLVGLEQRVQSLSPQEVAIETSRQIRALSNRISETMKSVRKIISELRPGILDDLGLCAAIEWQAKEFENRVGLPCRIVTDGTEEIPIGPEKSSALFRILQEALTNITRHAQAKNVTIKLAANGKSVTMEVADDGRGITDLHAAQTNSFGLLGIRERAHQFQGECVIDSAPGQGTRISITLPLDLRPTV